MLLSRLVSTCMRIAFTVTVAGHLVTASHFVCRFTSQDKYLHTNCLAALANMSSEFTNLNSFVAQKVVHLYSQLCKRHSRLVDQIRASAMMSQDQSQLAEGSELQDLSVLEEVLRMVLEVINSTLTSHLQHNPHLVYSILYNREQFAMFRAHPTFQDILQNIDTVLNYFSTRLEPLGTNPSSKDVLQTIKDAGMTFKKDKLKKFPELKFKYVEEESPEEFFIPYVWSLVYHCSNLYFNPTRILLFSLNTGTAEPTVAGKTG
ncbi:dymeclin [Elysia marginata]|uniref:Dymeclin n=1 Tax=Elysia marginata TaxID=1093978 RepID=A0AAV4HNU5_9GAST|nr:dymeclin [Elysia marginata]